ncbi:MAG: non-homologous end-joining DNA ligase [Candidatus Nanoarchaeia archaeon]|nr:non-homologous end-joining DNA ligase [Candidatus Haiyanarchaeum thermophilum]MCW1303056.1 non-homologous end-joining DNA ligase [Candidatus Haiyanarchaeum thermophilum]MCW1303721.1 non-homologous end-joining DNA ligase [Candidatus Haiyanarchaeum thermophilum]MCW1306834.1 non-homologous end-joining DNA ligase [Candidatus Haiyanarchaeum thermophilum]MCW1307076.1 non-homologous end-joining DNA ligase [Candidatus Haiyanarchaeum thermophilum]
MEGDLFDQKIKPMLAFSARPFDSEQYLFEIKYDGTRTIVYIDKEKERVKFLNRRGLFFEKRYPEILKELPNAFLGNKGILDGEIVVLDGEKPNFWKLQEREHTSDELRIELLSKLSPATLFIFDILYKDGKSLLEFPLIERKRILGECVTEGERVKLTRFIIGGGIKFFEEVAKKGFEGIMAKKIDSPYLIGERSKYWLKIKATKTVDCVICGFTRGEGIREKYLGALVLGCLDEGKLRYVGRVGTGFSESDLAKLKEMLEPITIDKNPFEIFEEEPNMAEKMVFVEPRYICEVKCMEITKDKKLRAPVFLRIREDKTIYECRLE